MENYFDDGRITKKEKILFKKNELITEKQEALTMLIREIRPAMDTQQFAVLVILMRDLLRDTAELAYERGYNLAVELLRDPEPYEDLTDEKA